MPNQHYHSSRQAGFTLIEMMAVLGIMAILMAIAIPRFMSVLPGLRVTQAARQLATDLQLARMKAISQNRRFRVNFVSATSYTIERDNGGAFVTDSGPYNLPDGILAAVGATWAFQPRGTADTTSGVSAVTVAHGAQSAGVQITPVGRINVQ
jgi:prepilin-type N-terminal cleavage/methylation domain-containing protein